MDNWIALSDQPDPLQPTTDGLLHAGLLVMEMDVPPGSAKVLLDFQAADPWPRTFAVFHDPAAGLVILHRQGNTVVRHHLPGPLAVGKGTARLSFRFDAPARSWSLGLVNLGPDGRQVGAAMRSSGRNPLPIRLADLTGICDRSAGTRRHASVLWFGITRGVAPPTHAPWIGLRTPIETRRGIIPADHLIAGDMVQTPDDGFVALLAVHRRDLPSRGAFAPILLRAPYFCVGHDLLVSCDQKVAIAGSEVEYLFGVDEVLIEARMLVDGRTALRDQRRAVTRSVALDFGASVLVGVDGCVLMCAARQSVAELLPPPRRCLEAFEVLPLMALLGRPSQWRAA